MSKISHHRFTLSEKKSVTGAVPWTCQLYSDSVDALNVMFLVTF